MTSDSAKRPSARLVAWVVACQDKRVRIYAPNELLRRRWAEELERHVSMLNRLGGTYDGVRTKHIRQGEVERLHSGPGAT